MIPLVQQKDNQNEAYNNGVGGEEEEEDGLPSLRIWEKTVLQLQILKKITGKVTFFFFSQRCVSSAAVLRIAV